MSNRWAVSQWPHIKTNHIRPFLPLSDMPVLLQIVLQRDTASTCSSLEGRWSPPAKKSHSQFSSVSFTKELTRGTSCLNVILRLSSSLPTHPLPAEAKAEAVQLLPHELDITDEVTQSDDVNGSTNDNKRDLMYTFLSTPLGRVLSQWLRFLLEVQKHPSPLDSAPVEEELPELKSCAVQQMEILSSSRGTWTQTPNTHYCIQWNSTTTLKRGILTDTEFNKLLRPSHRLNSQPLS